GYDIPQPRLPAALAAILAACQAGDKSCHLGLPGRIVRITSRDRHEALQLASAQDDFRVFVVDAGGTLVENVRVRLWRKGRGSSLVALSARAPVARVRVTHTPLETVDPPVTDTSVTFPIDAVYTWVDATDPGWREQLAAYRDVGDLDLDRFAQSDELRYSLRALDLFVPWIRRVHILSNCRPPAWFQPSDRVRWIDHREVIDQSFLPLFNSEAIETFLHRIPDLAEHFLYLNDDFFIWNDADPSAFFTSDGRSVAHLAPRGGVIYWMQSIEAGVAQDWQSARVNGARLLLARHGFLPTRQHEHVPYALSRSAIEELESEFASEFEAVRRSRFRDATDVSLIPFVYHHWAVKQGRAVASTAGHRSLEADFQRALDPAALTRAEFLCINDREGSATDPRVRGAKERLLAARLPIRSSAER
ncbi:MAG: stealth conserved region 3 domain-containing protein, partial [Chloroflexota bacterium]|nr:stealth conserved region 3 domain-containing protein [Chloroflexota bacterium]